MTKPPRLPELRSVSLRLHASTRSVTWAVIYRTARGDAVFDRRVSSGVIQDAPAMVGPEGVLRALRLALEDLEARYGFPPAEGRPGAPGGGGGRPGPSHEGLLPPVHLVQDLDEP